MQQRVRGRAALPFLLALLGVVAHAFAGCATGSDSAEEGGPDAAASGDDGAVTNDSASPADGGVDATPKGDADASGGAGDDGGLDASADPDASDVDGSPGLDAGADADAGSVDAGPTVIFGASCPTGTKYVEPFLHDPIADGTFLPLAGASTFDGVGNTLSLAQSSANTQVWIGARPSWTSYTVSARVRIDATTSNGNGGFNFRMQSTPTSPSNNAGQMYYAGIATNQVLLGIENGNWTELSGPSASFAVGTFYTLSVTATGSSLSVSVDGTPYITAYTDGNYAFGAIGLRTYASAMTYGAVTVTCL